MPRGWLSFAAAGLIALSLAIKLAVLDVAVGEDSRAAIGELSEAIASDGFKPSVPRPDLPIVRAERAGCVLALRVLDSHGTDRDTELLKLPAGWSVQYAWRGSWRPAMPRLGPLSDYYVARELARMGIATHRHPVIMLSLPPGCVPPDPGKLDIQVRLRREPHARVQ